MNTRLENLFPYPFERLNELLEGVVPAANLPFIALSLGEPKHPAADFLVAGYRDTDLIRRGLGTYPPTRGLVELRTAIAGFITQRFKLEDSPIDPNSQVLPVNGTREALFAFAQAVIDPQNPGTTLMPNPFYQIYEGAALLAGSRPVYLNCTDRSGMIPDFASIPADTWQACELIYICSPGNPSGAVIPRDTLEKLVELALEHNFVIAADECYSEIYPDENNPPVGLLSAALSAGNRNYRNCIAFNSLSKRSNLPGLRSGYVAGDADLINRFLLYRTYHGSAMPVHNQHLSQMAWSDESHVVANRATYRAKYDRVLEILEPVWPQERPAGGFYLWPETPVGDLEFTQLLLERANIKVLPGSYLSRESDGINPGTNRVRMALVATLEECNDAAERLADFMTRL